MGILAWVTLLPLFGAALVMLVLAVLTAITVPYYNGARLDSQMNSMASAISGVVAQTRYAAIMNSQIYTLVFTAPANTYVVTNVSTSTAASAVPLPTTTVTINTGTSATYTFTFCPNGTAYGSGGTCPGTNAPPVLTLANSQRKLQLNVSSVGNVTTTIIK